MDKKILFFDIDGTLIGRSTELRSSTLRALQSAKEKGYILFISTGRALASIYPSIKELGFDGYITSAGSIIYVNNQTIYEHYLPKAKVAQILELFQKHNIYFTLETKHALYQTDGIKDFFDKLHEIEARSNQELERMRETRRNLPTSRKLSEFNLDIPVPKVTFVSPRKEDFLNIKHHFEDYFNIVLFSEDDKAYCNGELIDKTCTKGHALKKVCEYYQIPVEDSIAFGDSMNDYEMLSMAGTSVVFEGASESLKALGDYFFENPDSDGILKIMQEMNLI